MLEVHVFTETLELDGELNMLFDSEDTCGSLSSFAEAEGDGENERCSWKSDHKIFYSLYL